MKKDTEKKNDAVPHETSWQKALRVKKEKQAAGELRPSTQNLIVKAKRNPRSLQMAISAMCFYCIGGIEEDMPDPGWKEEIGNCTATLCPLLPHRPHQRKIGEIH